MRNSDLINQRNQAIYQKYCEMYFGEMKREEVIWPELKKLFWLEEDTLYRIVLKVSKEADAAPNQLELPLNPTANEIQVNQQ